MDKAEKFYMEELSVPVITDQRADNISVRRFSSRKNEGMYLNGIKGYIRLDKIPTDILPLLLAGELIHIGKNTSFGFGKYKVKC